MLKTAILKNRQHDHLGDMYATRILSVVGNWIDAVTSATISSAIIFNSISQGESLLEELRLEGVL
jgi:hypothetical protein